MSAPSKKDFALPLAREGFWIFPLLSNTKIPPKGMHFKEFATRNKDQIRAWWTETPDANIGVYCGKWGDNGEALAVVDIDMHGDVDGWATAEALDEQFKFPSTYRVDTPSGGRHLYFIVPRPLSGGTKKLGPGVDLKSHGGYVVGEGSTIDGKTYARAG